MRTEYKPGDLLTKDDIGLVFRGRDFREWKISEIISLANRFIVIDKDGNEGRYLREDGRWGLHDGYYDCDLVSFVGPDFSEAIENKTITDNTISKEEYLKDKLKILNIMLEIAKHIRFREMPETIEDLPNGGRLRYGFEARIEKYLEEIIAEQGKAQQ